MPAPRRKAARPTAAAKRDRAATGKQQLEGCPIESISTETLIAIMDLLPDREDQFSMARVCQRFKPIALEAMYKEATVGSLEEAQALVKSHGLSAKKPTVNHLASYTRSLVLDLDFHLPAPDSSEGIAEFIHQQELSKMPSQYHKAILAIIKACAGGELRKLSLSFAASSSVTQQFEVAEAMRKGGIACEELNIVHCQSMAILCLLKPHENTLVNLTICGALTGFGSDAELPSGSLAKYFPRLDDGLKNLVSLQLSECPLWEEDAWSNLLVQLAPRLQNFAYHTPEDIDAESKVSINDLLAKCEFPALKRVRFDGVSGGALLSVIASTTALEFLGGFDLQDVKESILTRIPVSVRKLGIAGLSTTYDPPSELLTSIRRLSNIDTFPLLKFRYNQQPDDAEAERLQHATEAVLQYFAAKGIAMPEDEEYDQLAYIVRDDDEDWEDEDDEDDDDDDEDDDDDDSDGDEEGDEELDEMDDADIADFLASLPPGTFDMF